VQDSKKLALNPFFQDKGTVEFCVLSEEFVSTNTDKNCLWKTNPVNLSLRNIDIYQANSLPLTISIRYVNSLSIWYNVFFFYHRQKTFQGTF